MTRRSVVSPPRLCGCGLRMRLRPALVWVCDHCDVPAELRHPSLRGER